MEIGSGCSDAKWARLIQTIDDGIRTIALNANVSHEELRCRYIMTCLHVTRPFECTKYQIANMVAKQKAEFKAAALSVSSATTVIASKYKGTLVEQIAAGDNIAMQNGKDTSSRSKLCQNAPSGYNRVHLHSIHTQPQHQLQKPQQLGGGSYSNQRTIIRQRPQQSFYSRTIRGSSLPPYRAPITITSNQIHQSNVVNCCKIGNGIVNNNTTIVKPTQPKALLQPKDAKSKKVAKFFCDIEAALAGEISDVDDDEEPLVVRGTLLSKPSNGAGTLRTSASMAKETISLVEAQMKKIKQPETRIVRYPSGKALALNVLHKIYVIQLENAHAWVRLCDGERPPCFDAAHVTMKALKPLEWEELLPGTPCVVFTRFNPLDIVNDGVARELTEFESHARAIVEECHSATKTVTVRLVDFGFRLAHLAATSIKPLTMAFDGPPLALRLQIDLLPKQQRESLCRYATLCVRLTVARDKQFLCWTKTWKAIGAQKQNWNKDNSDCASNAKSSDTRNLKDQQQRCASPSLGPVTRAFVSSWLNKDHKRAGGKGFEAALCGIAECRADLPPSEFAVKAANKFSGNESLQSTQSSHDSDRITQNVAEKMDEEWPALGQLPKTSAKKVSLPLLKKKESKRKEKKQCAMKEELAEEQHNHNQPQDSANGVNAIAVVAEPASEISDGQKASLSMTTVHTCRDLL